MDEFIKSLKPWELDSLIRYGGVRRSSEPLPSLPKGLEQCDPYQRIFPLSWKQAYFRLNFNEELKGYICPICKNVFSGTQGFRQLRADHIHPFSRGGLTVWHNLQLLCVKCNSEKSDKL